MAANIKLLVIDVSVAGAWFLKDEASELAVEALTLIERREAALITPTLWHYEFNNLLLVAERRGRLTKKAAEDARRFIDKLQLTVESLNPVSQESAYVLAQAHRLSFYDAIYLELAYRHDALLITADKVLRRAALQINVSLEL